MEAAIKLEVEKDNDQTREEVKVGMFVASNGQNAGVLDVWQRGVVVAMDKENDAKIYEVTLNHMCTSNSLITSTNSEWCLCY